MLEEFCKEIGCSGINSKCPGNPNCTIIRKVIDEVKNKVAEHQSESDSEDFAG